MSTKQLAEVFEELKELRRQGPSMEEVLASIRRIIADDEAKAPPDDDKPAAATEPGNDNQFKVDLSFHLSIVSLLEAQPEALSRFLEIKTLADRVFGDEKKAEAWLQRPTAALSGQRPADLLKDELGAAVVREMLEQIDHGIFA